MSIFDQIGGPAAVTAAVDDFYRRVIADPELTPYFDGVDMKRLKGHQRSFIAAAIGGPEPYLGRSMREAHSHLDIAPAHFDRVVDHLAETLADLGVSVDIIGQIGAKLAPLKDEIVSPGAAARAS
ncbi:MULTISPECIES: group I truncated hemoglobin [Mycolicibacterium]|jgi:hemoglobin|uniref:Group 1 truncated hemoglobin n=2 Tax=Mycolicibacterium TaxID=1866885 RepID=A1T9D6_MYCVP|nr:MULTISPECIES: group 1 truncated hemoglobin [Mycolicibacterium]ABM13786.1 globin [Mycolicibacterium vanbaalenii PYR-1]MCV7128786.1 group 1 truncated hemoglobin [Mycolicibacterium vanbaalenii PYR-1]MDN4518875.1 group 1 truncated hemoglobin [Mycolicibacterium austroafricanum]MDW5609811.1 group 1 truncated hemoglobin [Mycolicibacterium sp. D5.8-2]PQP44688.1 group 1 truncated hemoglobin [Mycolicibacterium austroafricanum]